MIKLTGTPVLTCVAPTEVTNGQEFPTRGANVGPPDSLSVPSSERQTPPKPETPVSPEEIRKTIPWLAHLMDRNEQIGALVQTLSSLAMVTLNATLPFLLEGASVTLSLISRINRIYRLQVSLTFKHFPPGVGLNSRS